MPDPAHAHPGQQPDEEPEGPQRRPFAAFLQEHRRGALHDALGDHLADVVSSVMETRKKGTLTVQFTISPNGDDGVKVSDKVTPKPPIADGGEAVFYADDNGNLTRNDPRQPRLPLNELDHKRGI